jgi:serine/threonine-protein kinase
VLIFLGVLAFIIINLVQSVTNPPDNPLFDVPRLQGRTYDVSFEAWFGETHPDFTLIVRREYDVDRAKDVIIRQEPQPGDKRQSGTAITITVSLGPRQVEVPDFDGYEWRDVEAALIAAGLRLGEVRRTEHNTVERNYVISSSPAAYTTVNEGSIVDILVSLGKEVKSFNMPNYVGSMLTAAERELKNTYNMEVLVVYREDETAPLGQVIEQDIFPTTLVQEGRTVTLTVSSGPPPSVEPPPPPPTQSEEPSPPPTQSEEPSPSQSEEPSPSVEPPSPSDEPSPPPSEEPPPPVIVTNTFTIDLSAYAESVFIEIRTVSGDLVETRTADPGTASLQVSLSGLAGTEYHIFIDGALSQVVTLR